MSQPLEVTDPADAHEQAEWAKAAKFMTGGVDPDGDEPEAGSEQKPEELEFSYRGRKVKVDAETHGILEELRKEARSGNGRIGSELARTRERLARLEASAAARGTTEQRPDDDADILRLKPDPKLATRDFPAWEAANETYQDAKAARKLERLEQKYREDQAAQQTRADEARRTTDWANRFYATYDHYDDPILKPVVTQAYLDNRAEIDAYGEDVEAAHERLAELADERLVRLKKAGKIADDATSTPNDNRRRVPTIESSARATPRGEQKPDESRRDFSASSWVAKQRLLMTGRTPRK